VRQLCCPGVSFWKVARIFQRSDRGDIDLGGFRIFRSLKDVVPTVRPYLMDVETLMKHREQCQPLAKGYGKLLECSVY